MVKRIGSSWTRKSTSKHSSTSSTRFLWDAGHLRVWEGRGWRAAGSADYRLLADSAPGGLSEPDHSFREPTTSAGRSPGEAGQRHLALWWRFALSQPSGGSASGCRGGLRDSGPARRGHFTVAAQAFVRAVRVEVG